MSKRLRVGAWIAWAISGAAMIWIGAPVAVVIAYGVLMWLAVKGCDNDGTCSF